MNVGRRGRLGISASAVALALLVFFLAPVVPYSVAFTIPGNIFGKPFDTCVPILSRGSSSTYNATKQAEFEACLNQNAYPPTAVTGYAPLSYSLFGYGRQPFPQYALVSQGWRSSLVFFDGSGISFALGSSNGLTPSYLFTNHTVLNPKGVLDVEDARIWPAGSGYLNFTIGVRNIGQSDVYINQVGFLYSGYGTNRTYEGVRWLAPTGASWACGSAAAGIGLLKAGYACDAYSLAGPNPNLQAGGNYTLLVVVSGAYYTPPVSIPVSGTQTVVTATGVPYGGPNTDFVYVKSFTVEYPGNGPNAEWMKGFIQLVNGYRGDAPLTEDPALDNFAQTRFETASSNYQISDFGFDNQSAQYFAGSGKLSTEEILYPSNYSPSAFVGVLQKQAPAHWAGLLDRSYVHFGYYIGNAPSVEFNLSCPVTEITQRNVNITQIAIQNGCKYEVNAVTWLLIVLSS